MPRHPLAAVPQPGQTSVWDYPRPPRLETVTARVRIEFGGTVVADTRQALRVCETASPPTYYLPRADVAPGVLIAAPGGSVCEWKGRAVYWSVRAGGREVSLAAWSYPDPRPAFAALRGHVAFYAGPMDACWVGDERVTPQPGGFYGGWITADLAGPFQGPPGTAHW